MTFSFSNFKVTNLIKNPLASNTLWMIFALGIRLVLQAVYFVIIAKALGPTEYGAFISSIALVAIISPFASLGTGSLLVKNMSRDRELFGIYWGNSIFVIFVFGLICIALLVPIARFFMPDSVPLKLILLVACSDLLFAKVIDTAGKVFQSVQRLSRTGLINISVAACRLLAALMVVNMSSSIVTALDWGYYYLSSTFLAALFAFTLVHHNFGRPRLELSRLKPEALEGIYFSISIAGQNVYNMIDKVMLARLSTLEATGIYGAASRLTEMGMIPIRALLQASYSNFFKHGETGISGSLIVARRLSPIAGFYGITAGLGIFLIAPVVPFILGDEYRVAINALRWMAPIPFLKAMHYIASDTLSGAGFQGIRSVLLVSTALVNIIANFLLIPLYSWKGAVWASLISNSFLMVALWSVVLGHYLHEMSFKKQNL